MFSNPDATTRTATSTTPIGPRLQYNRDTTFPSTDWRALTVGYDTSASASDPESTQVPLENVLIGIRCYETDWTAPLAGCRYSLTAQLLPFTLQPGDRIVSPMGRIYRAENANGGTVASPATHIYRVASATTPSASTSSATARTTRPRPTPASSASRCSNATGGQARAAVRRAHQPVGVVLAHGDGVRRQPGRLQDETAAMLDYEGRILRKGGCRRWAAWEARSVAGKGALRPSLCKTGDAGCRARVDPSTLSDARTPATAKRRSRTS